MPQIQRIEMTPRKDWVKRAEDEGFMFHTIDGVPYWDETSAYAFTLEQIEEGIEAPSNELHKMCRDAVAYVVESEELLEKLMIPAEHMDLVRNSWRANEPELYGRFDLAYDGTGHAKMLEYNADTPTSLFESASFQWGWLEDVLASGALPAGSDQFNSIFEGLSARFKEIIEPGSDMHFAAIEAAPEDYGTVETMAWAAKNAGITPHFTDLEHIGLTTENQFADAEGRVIGTLFKLYPWEALLREEYGQYISQSGCRFIEPAWKAVLSNKGILPVLWRLFEGHQNLLPCFFEDEIGKTAAYRRSQTQFERCGFVNKPIFSREGASIRIETPNLKIASNDLSYDENPRIVQAYHALPEFNGNHAVIGSWMVGEECRGIGIREDNSQITMDTSRFKPHFIIS